MRWPALPKYHLPMAEKVDLKRTLDAYQARRNQFRILGVPTMQYVMVDGHGDPNTSPQYVAAVEALYRVSYALKFASKRELGRDYVVMPLEGLWWADDMETFTSRRDKSMWRWTMMVMTPDWISGDLFATVVQQVRTQEAPPRPDQLRLVSLAEGLCVQTLHVGSYDDEAGVLERMHSEFIPVNGLRMTGKHHEIYLSDPRRTAPEKLRTILRQPVERVEG